MKFWNIIEVPDKPKKVNIDLSALVTFLDKNGFRRLNHIDAPKDGLPLVQISPLKIVSMRSIADVRNFVRNNVVDGNKDLHIVREYLMRTTLFSYSALFDYLPEIKASEIGLPAIKGEVWLARANGLVKISANKIELKPYGSIDICVWEDTIVNRNWIDNISEDCYFSKFIDNVSDGKTESFRRVAGYILTDYFAPAAAYAIILNDCVTEDGASDGRRGKTLFARVLGSIKGKNSICELDGKRIDLNSPFAFQTATLNTKICYIDDCDSNFNFVKMYSMITSSHIKIEKKGMNPFETQSPKWVLSTNTAIRGSGASDIGRKFQLEFSDHYTVDYSPVDEFGHTFIEDWSIDEWQKLDHWAANSIQLYLEGGLGKQTTTPEFKERQLVIDTDPVFIEWADINLTTGNHWKPDVYNRFIANVPQRQQHLYSNVTFYKWICAWAKARNANYKVIKSNGIRGFSLTRQDIFVFQNN